MRSRFQEKISRKQPVNIAIIGGGAGAREFIISYSELGGIEIPSQITVFEPREKLGRGIAWDENNDYLIANMRVETLGPNYNEFDKIKGLLKQMNHPEKNQEYPSRKAMGEALDKRWNDKMSNLPTNWSIRHIRKVATVLNWCDVARNAEVVCADTSQYKDFDIVILALGNIPAKSSSVDHECTVINGWDTEKIHQIDKDADILIKGAGLTSIDITLRLINQGHNIAKSGSIVWHSRKGTLPYVRPRQIKLEPQYISYPNIVNSVDMLKRDDKKLSLEDVVTLFLRELDAQAIREKGNYLENSDLLGLKELVKTYESPQNCYKLLEQGIKASHNDSLWFSVAKLLDEYTIPLIWNAMDEAAKYKFIQTHRRTFDCFWAPIPVNNGRYLKDWIDKNVIQLIKGLPEKRGPDKKEKGPVSDYWPHPLLKHKVYYDNKFEDPLEPTEESDKRLKERYKNGFDVVIDASGIPADPAQFDSQLVQDMIMKKYVRPYKLRSGPNKQTCRILGVEIDWYSGKVLSPENSQDWLYTLTGSLTAGAHRFTNSYFAVSASAQRTVSSLLMRSSNIQETKT